MYTGGREDSDRLPATAAHKHGKSKKTTHTNNSASCNNNKKQTRQPDEWEKVKKKLEKVHYSSSCVQCYQLACSHFCLLIESLLF